MVAKHRRNNALVANDSHQFSLYPLVRDYALKEAQTTGLRRHVAVYIAACKVVDLIKLVKHRRLSTQDAKPLLLTAVGEWFHLHKVQYGTVHVKPTFFFLDVGDRGTHCG